jgi:hypothetical protein
MYDELQRIRLNIITGFLISPPLFCQRHQPNMFVIQSSGEHLLTGGRLKRENAVTARAPLPVGP